MDFLEFSSIDCKQSKATQKFRGTFSRFLGVLGASGYVKRTSGLELSEAEVRYSLRSKVLYLGNTQKTLYKLVCTYPGCTASCRRLDPMRKIRAST